jgi:hypothetical protein
MIPISKPSAAKAGLIHAVAARLKPCPDVKHASGILIGCSQNDSVRFPVSAPEHAAQKLFDAGVGEGVGHGLAVIVEGPLLGDVVFVQNGESERRHVGFIRRFGSG